MNGEYGRARRLPIGVVGAALMLGGLAALAWHRSGPLPSERPIITEMVRFAPPGAHMWIVLLQPTTFMSLTFALATAAVLSGRTAVGIVGTAGCLGAVAVNERILKPLVGRVRPIHLPARLTGATLLHPPTYVAIAKVHVHRPSPMFPSTHVTAAAACATFAWWLLRPYGRGVASLAAVVPCATSAAVIATHNHYPSDAAAGLLVGSLFVSIIMHGPRRITAITHTRRRRDPRPHDRAPIHHATT